MDQDSCSYNSRVLGNTPFALHSRDITPQRTNVALRVRLQTLDSGALHLPELSKDMENSGGDADLVGTVCSARHRRDSRPPRVHTWSSVDVQHKILSRDSRGGRSTSLRVWGHT